MFLLIALALFAAWLLPAAVLPPTLDVVEPLTTSVYLLLLFAFYFVFPELETCPLPITLSLFTVKLCGVRLETRFTT